MSWKLEIHHLDIGHAGDATLIIAGNDDVKPPIKQVVLIDGGEYSDGAIIADYCFKNNIQKIDVIAITHYDKDHFYGVIYLLENTNLCDNAKIYDLGQLPAAAEQDIYGDNPLKRGTKTSYYKRYLDGIRGKLTIRHVTKLVNGFDIAKIWLDVTKNKDVVAIPRPTIDHPHILGAYLAPHWLIDKEIMWGNGRDGLEGRMVFASDMPQGAPQITCISANLYVSKNDGNIGFISDAIIYNGNYRFNDEEIKEELNKDNKSNGRSLGFLVSFNNFRYYVGGDLDSEHEDGFLNTHFNNPTFQPGLIDILNSRNNLAGRVLAMKTSHHGSDSASSREFISRMRPSAAFISTGKSNKYDHPGQMTINVLEGYPRVPILGETETFDHPPKPPLPPGRPVKYYLTGYQNNSPLETYGGDSSETAGVPKRGTPGHILLSVTEEQSLKPVVGQIYRGILAAASATVLFAAMHDSELNDELGDGLIYLENIAEIGATSGTACAVADAVGASVLAAENALEAIAWVGDDGKGRGVISDAFLYLNDKEMGGEEAAIQAAKDLGRINNNKFGRGMEETIVYAINGKNASEIIHLAQIAGVDLDAAIAAGHAAEEVYNTFEDSFTDIDIAGFAAAAAIAAVKGGALEYQAAAIAAAIAATLGGEILTAALTAKMVVNSAMNAGMGNGRAALAGAVAGASWFEGDPDSVKEATFSALLAAGIPSEVANTASVSAMEAANLPNDGLFTVRFTIDDILNNIDVTTIITHSS